MKERFLFNAAAAMLFAVTLLVQSVLPVHAADNAAERGRLATVIKLDPPGDTPMGAPFILSGSIHDYFGRPVADKAILFEINGEHLGQARSDTQGKFEREFNKLLNGGVYEITATTNQTPYLSKSSSTISLKILPAEVTVQAIPAIEGAAFEMDGKKFYSNEEGLVTIQINRAGPHRLHVLADEYQNPYQKIEFGRWPEENFRPYLDLDVPTDKVIQVGLNVYHLQSQSFFDLDGYPVDPERISTIKIKSLQGDVFELPDGQSRWFPASRVARRVTGLEETKIYYSIVEVNLDGSNVVNQSQQRFYTSAGGNWTITLTLYSLQFRAQDAIFGTPVGKTLDLEYPDGRLESYPLDDNGSIVIHSLARGTYFIKVGGVNGVSNRIPVRLSRNQDVITKIITVWDMTLAAIAAIALALGLLFFGRPWLFHAGMKTRAGIAVKSGAAHLRKVWDKKYPRHMAAGVEKAFPEAPEQHEGKGTV